MARLCEVRCEDQTCDWGPWRCSSRRSWRFRLWAQFAATATTNATYAIKGGKVFTLTGAPIENGTVIIRDGKIAAVGANIAVPGGAQVIDATGLEVYPGLFDPVTQIGLDGSERGERDAGYQPSWAITIRNSSRRRL